MEPASTPLSQISVLFADSHQTQRQLLVGALRRRPELRVTTCESTTDDILEAASDAALEVAVLNVSPPRSGWPDLTIVRRLHLARPEMAKILLLEFSERDMVIS